MVVYKQKILLVEDDLNLGFLLVDFLELEGFEVKLCRDGNAGLKAFNHNSYDICLLDCMLPGKDGFTLASQIRSQNKNIPIIFLTAKSLKEDKIKGFQIGADDYITKPFEEEELVYRIRAVLKRTKEQENTSTDEGPFNIGKFTFDYKMQTLIFNKTEKRITEKESEILRLLCLNKKRILKREEILISIWGANDYFHGRSLDVFITKIRKYLQDDPRISIENVHSVGFILNE